tara:strand:- start:280 stop:474 length:195 start_codon:yes stop_codon:yes gene_type:complete
MVATYRSKAGFKAGEKSDRQQAKENIRNRQTCSMRYRKVVPVSIRTAPWENEEDDKKGFSDGNK